MRTQEVEQAMSYLREGIEGEHLVDYKHKATISWTLDILAAEVERLREGGQK